ncbi:hypothetical protein [Pedobacter caeni]|uniref:Uncharacterized protein n=1 Tax=Pedobacter caeni TaxID=288992 RepID=A0A1M5MMA2_9SPHI|nr:hypothetical protein [Pedobacter caeni]SHG77903.1 hypothetical protein SAMN04488522_107226 [Pedobacter caeni]
MTESSKKYKINDYLNRLNIKEYRLAVQIIPKILGVSLNTFHNYRNILWNSTQDIPYEKVVMFEQLFDMRPGELFNQTISVKRLRDLFESEVSSKTEQMEGR